MHVIPLVLRRRRDADGPPPASPLDKGGDDVPHWDKRPAAAARRYEDVLEMQDSYNARPHRSQSDDLDAVLPDAAPHAAGSP